MNEQLGGNTNSNMGVDTLVYNNHVLVELCHHIVVSEAREEVVIIAHASLGVLVIIPECSL